LSSSNQPTISNGAQFDKNWSLLAVAVATKTKHIDAVNLCTGGVIQRSCEDIPPSRGIAILADTGQ
jgi:hypothetical protein